ncbi:hypothetical protein AC578_6806 [Pseudocercospora eumusae]|uniref:Uncharacterized protein n=1 Tax=Pseudocercospora eumusae TaxID=321146 RepID=A0A139GWA6_9PEZI|nr:hypothetical protein AC578_6806 [Pseudocercospora eumusae]
MEPDLAEDGRSTDTPTPPGHASFIIQLSAELSKAIQSFSSHPGLRSPSAASRLHRELANAEECDVYEKAKFVRKMQHAAKYSLCVVTSADVWRQAQIYQHLLGPVDVIEQLPAELSKDIQSYRDLKILLIASCCYHLRSPRKTEYAIIVSWVTTSR